MLRRDFIIRNKTGLHARPASIFIKTANKFKCDIHLVKDGQEIDGKSIISLLTIGARQGSMIIITTNGTDEKVAMDELINVLNSLED
ncbi:Phosphotransferase system, HPr histidine phosphorylation site [Acididesulfobacillus acetoxydans]|uniref:Phosphocarrier protein HPr n=1 Tax=Acididesulfobacillus acetoxydans TaxID=1561005 RepID=A0A8S0W7L3_9FIRM|nr:HPr family phosphocarrier protein [Acididesulfobacillus acetoxydans]CAA7600899.1 Phosphotransferase system, HPr histidine phosphorylation site [Acididesulfobacillus acetoxydans]CEJ08944.1 Phosphocarrier protein signature [Acididesulfobacillus acetoxydans]